MNQPTNMTRLEVVEAETNKVTKTVDLTTQDPVHIQAMSDSLLRNLDTLKFFIRATPSTVLTDERTAFEAWADEAGYPTRRGFGDANDYDFVETRRMWESWQGCAEVAAQAGQVAAPEARVREMPKCIEGFVIEDGRLVSGDPDLSRLKDGTYWLCTAPIYHAPSPAPAAEKAV